MRTNVYSADAVVIGGGIHGCSAALQLARRSIKVIVLEKDHVARHASGVNVGGVRRLGRNVAEVPISQAAWELWQDIPGLVDDNCGFSRSRYLKVARSEPGVVHAFGFSAHGFQLAPAVGAIVADLVLGETPNLPIKPFRVGRFSA